MGKGDVYLYYAVACMYRWMLEEARKNIALLA
jgi:hypothetical protein